MLHSYGLFGLNPSKLYLKSILTSFVAISSHLAYSHYAYLPTLLLKIHKIKYTLEHTHTYTYAHKRIHTNYIVGKGEKVFKLIKLWDRLDRLMQELALKRVVVEMSICKMTIDKMTVDKMTLDYMNVHDTTVNYMTVDYMAVD